MVGVVGSSPIAPTNFWSELQSTGFTKGAPAFQKKGFWARPLLFYSAEFVD
jgi:hypothetical protein